jgi:hypothetical protein|nr:hypothetical protein [uncultured Mediterranean phage uvMED]BAR15808.1 hypothetical protein [uncultured Mediterranean phage uvMED]
MTKVKRIINGECHFTMTELFDDVEKAANVSNSGELVECKIDNLRIDFTTVKKEKDGRVENSSAEVQGSSSEETRQVPTSKAEGQ